MMAVTSFMLLLPPVLNPKVAETQRQAPHGALRLSAAGTCLPKHDACQSQAYL